MKRKTKKPKMPLYPSGYFVLNQKSAQFKLKSEKRKNNPKRNQESEDG